MFAKSQMGWRSSMMRQSLNGVTGTAMPQPPPPGPLAAHAAPTPMEVGIVIFNRDHTKDPKKRIGPTPISNNQHLPCTLEELLRDTLRIQQSYNKQQSAAQKRVGGILSAIHQHAKVIDVLIQQQPDITALVWGSMRFLIEVVVKDVHTSGSISDALVEIVENLGRWNKYIELFEESERVRETASHLFSQIINFCVRARIYYQKRQLFRYAKVAFTPYAQKLDDIMRVIRKHARTLELEASLASEIRKASNRKAEAEQLDREREEFIKQEEFRIDLSTQVRKNNKIAEDIAISSEVTNSTLTRAMDRLEQLTLTHESDAAVHWLQPWDSAPRLIPNIVEGTCTWIQQDDAYVSWREGCYSKLLCICGPPGSGKSAMASHLFETATTSVNAVHFFQVITNQDQAQPTYFTAALLADLLQMERVRSSSPYTSVINQVKALATSSKRINGNFPFRRLWLILLDLVKGLPDFTLIVDGLDECDSILRTELCMELIKLSSQPNARVITLFRPHAKLDGVFQDAVRVELTPTAVEKDILLYVTKEIEEHPKELQILREEIIEKINRSCQGMFLWAEMMLDGLKSAGTYSDKRQCLANCPPGLNNFYEEISPGRGAPLTENCLRRRREIFFVLLRAFRALTCDELSIVLALQVGDMRLDECDKLIDPEEEVLRLCWPFARVSQNHVHLMHESVKYFLIQVPSKPGYSIHITFEESDAYLARKCLVALSLEEYCSPSTIAILLRRNVASAATEQDEDKYFYQYAATHWYVHLTALCDPAIDLVKQAATFLEGNEFVSWSEYIFQLSGSQGMILEVQGKLKIWRDDLSQDLKDYLLLENYFVRPYRAVAKVFGDDGGDKTLPYICLFQLGEFYSLSDRLEEAFEVKKLVAEGLVNLLGENHPLALKAESAYALEYLGQGRFREAEEAFGRLAEIQRKELGTDRPDYYQSRQRQGMAEVWMTKYVEADMNLTESLSGFIRTVGPTDFLYLLSQQSLGCVLEGQGELIRATLEYEHVWRYRVSVLGQDNPMAIWSRCAMVSTYRKLGRLEDAGKAIKEVIDSRTRTIGGRAESTIDAVIQRIILLRESDKGPEAMELIDFISDGGLADSWFERVCQVDHIRALLENDSGNVELARVILQSLLDQAFEYGVKGRNRTLLWVRLDLAVILRRLKRDSEALMLFDDIITSIDNESSSSWEEAQAPAELRIAEEALQLMRERKTWDAEMLLEKNGFRWVRQEDFWMLAGGPAADTAWMKGP